MKCKVFAGPNLTAQDAFNKWAKGKALKRDIIIHTNCLIEEIEGHQQLYMVITVYHPEDEFWDKVQE